MSNSIIYIHPWEIFETITLLIGDGQEAKITLTPEDPLVVRVRFQTDQPKEGESSKTTVSWHIEGDGVLVFSNWNNKLGIAIPHPLEIAEDEKGRLIAVQCSVRKINEFHQVFFQFMKKVAE